MIQRLFFILKQFHVAQAGLEVTPQPRITLNTWSFFLHLSGLGAQERSTTASFWIDFKRNPRFRKLGKVPKI